MRWVCGGVALIEMFISPSFVKLWAEQMKLVKSKLKLKSVRNTFEMQSVSLDWFLNYKVSVAVIIGGIKGLKKHDKHMCSLWD